MANFLSAHAFAAGSGSLSDPPAESVITAAIVWVQGTLLGTMATIVAVLAIFSVGLLMLSGRVDTRLGLTVVLGCFILFGASTIAAGIQSAADRSDAVAVRNVPIAPPAPIISPPQPYQADDPYAGAAVPVR